MISLSLSLSLSLSHLHREVMEADVIMSPVRRSLRLTGKSDPGSHDDYQVSSLKELPDDLEVGYLPNKALF